MVSLLSKLHNRPCYSRHSVEEIWRSRFGVLLLPPINLSEQTNDKQ
jgi:hypothetical protein